MRSSCIVFDLDDTLYLERDYVRSGFRALESWTKSNLGLESFSFNAWALFERGERGNIFDRVLEQAGIQSDRNTIEIMVDMYRKHVPEIQLTDDAASCLHDLRGQIHLALLSDGPQQSQRNKIIALGLERTFETVVLTSSLGIGYAKPNLKAFLDVQKYYGPCVHQFTYVADNPMKDFIAPRKLGWATVRVRRNDGLYSYLEADKSVGADVEFSDLRPLTKSLIGGPQLPSH